MITTIIFLIVLSVLVFVHELGHFLIARLFKVRVDEFAIGFPPRLWSFKKGGTQYSINLIPLGGYVKIYGEGANDEMSPDNILAKPRWQQALVLIAGVVFNVLFAWGLFTSTLMVGAKAPVDDFPVEYSAKPTVLITGVAPVSPAEKAGLKAGDEIVGLQSGVSQNFSGISTSTLKADDVREQIILSTTTLGVTVNRNGTLQTFITTPKDGINGVQAGKKGLGIMMSDVVTVKLPLIPAIKAGFSQTVYLTKEIAVSTYDFLIRIFKGKAKSSEVSGPVGIATHVGEAARMGFVYLANFAAFISLNLAVLNLLPIPALDGGRLVVVILEAIRRKPFKQKILQGLNAISFILLLLLMIFVTIQDVVGLLR